MNKEMIISSSDQETRVAILEDDQVVEVFIERERQRGVVGNIYKGRVSKVLPGMQSSFVDIGLERDAFLYVSEVVNTVEEFERLESGDEEDGEPQTHRRRGVMAPRRLLVRRRRERRSRDATATSPAKIEDLPGRAGGARPGHPGAAQGTADVACDARALPGVPCRRWTVGARARSSRVTSGRACAASCAVPRAARLHRRVIIHCGERGRKGHP